MEKDILQEVRSLFEANDVEVIMVDTHTITFEGNEYQLRTRKGAYPVEEMHLDIAELIEEEELNKIFLYQANSLDIGDTSRITVRFAKYD